MKPLFLTKLTFLVAILLGWNLSVIAQTTTFATPGGPYTYTVPPGVTAIGIDMLGANGGNVQYPSAYGDGGKGGRVQCTLAVTAGQTYYIFVGGRGVNGPTCCTYGVTGGINGGGNSQFYYVGSGGGASDIRTVTGTYQ